MPFKALIRSFAAFLKANLVSLAGLSVGMMVTVLSVTYIVFESSYDRFHKNSERIFLVSTQLEIEPGNVVVMSGTHNEMKDYVDSHVPQVEMACRLRDSHDPIIIDQEKFKNHRGLYVDLEFFSMFDFKMIRGTGSDLAKPGRIILSSSLAKKFFGSYDSLGESIQIKNIVYSVSGIIENPPENSSIKFEYLLPIHNYLNTLEEYSSVSVESYIFTPVLYDNLSAVSEQMNGFYEAYDVKGKDQYKVSLSTLTGQNQYHNSTSKNFILFISVSILVLLVSIVNFINSYAAESEIRIRETGMRKVMGASRALLLRNMLINSVLISFIAAIIGLILSELLLKVFQDLTGIGVRQYGPGLFRIHVIMILIALVTGVLAGIFPALRYSSSDILSMIAGKGRIRGGGISIRKALVLVQYIISAGLLITLFTLFFQLRYLSQKDHGYITENRMLVEVPGSLEFNYSSYISELEKIPGVESISGNGSVFGGTVGFGLKLPGEEKGMPAMGYFVEDGFFRTYGIKLIDGKTFEETSGRDSATVIIDRSTAELLNLGNPVGKKVFLSRREVEIIGFVEDADLIALKGEEKPFFYTQFYDLCCELIVHYSGDPSIVAKAIAEKFKEFDTEAEYNFRSLPEARKILYEKEENQVKIVLFVGAIAMLLTIVGAYSMASYMARRRAKQLSIRKVMGATVVEVIQLSVREMTWMIVLSFIIASPMAYIISNKWLQVFTQKIKIGPLPFVLAFVVLYLLIFITVYYRERQAALSNPVDNLRQE